MKNWAGENENYVDKSLNQLVKHQPSGRRYWKYAINHSWGGDKNEIGKYWAEIEALINGSPLPVGNNKMNDSEKEWLKNLFQKYHIEKITLENGSLFVDYNQKVNSIEKAKIDNKLLQELREYCQNHDKHVIDSQSLGINSDSSSSNPNKNNYQLVIGLTISASVVLVVGILVYLIRKRKKTDKH